MHIILNSDQNYLHVVIAPCLHVIAAAHIHLHDAIVGNTQKTFLFVSIEFNNEQWNAVLGQTLPCLYIVQLWVDKRQSFHICMCVKHSVTGFFAQFFDETWSQVLCWIDVVWVDVDCWRLCRLLHTQEGSDARYFAVVRAVSEWSALCSQPTCCHPFCVLFLIITSNPHFAVGSGSELWRHFKSYMELSLCQIDFRCDFAPAEIDGNRWWCAAATFFAALVQIQMQVFVREPVTFVSFQCELFWSEKKWMLLKPRILMKFFWTYLKNLK